MILSDCLEQTGHKVKVIHYRILARLDMLDRAGLIQFTANGTPRLKRYLAASPGQVPPDVWTDVPPVNSQARERTGYPTKKPLTLLDRIIKASSNPGDIVLDPFCGCATALVAAADRPGMGGHRPLAVGGETGQ